MSNKKLVKQIKHRIAQKNARKKQLRKKRSDKVNAMLKENSIKVKKLMNDPEALHRRLAEREQAVMTQSSINKAKEDPLDTEIKQQDIDI